MMVSFICELLDTKLGRVVKRQTIIAPTSNKAIDKFALKIHKKYDLKEMRTPSYARYVIMTGRQK